MKNEKGISTWAVILIIALLIGAAVLWTKYFARPMATVMMQGADQAKPAIERANKASESVSRTIKVEEEATKKMNEDATKQQE
jgi:archaellum component FlaF (FlaF/FlaG flagellin family)